MSRHTDNLEMANAQLAFTMRKSRQWAKGVIEQRNEKTKANLEQVDVSQANEVRVRPQTTGTNQVEQLQVDSPLWFFNSHSMSILTMIFIIALMSISVSYCGRLAIEKEVKADAVDLSLPMKRVRNLEQF